MFRKIFAATCALALCTSAFADISHWVSEPYQPAVSPGSDPLHPDFNDGSYWTVDLMVTISGNDDWTSSGNFEATLFGGQFFYHAIGDRTPPLAAFVSIYPAVEYDTMFLSTEADGHNQPPFNDPSFAGDRVFDPQNIQVEAWFDTPENGGDGDFVVARFTVKLTGGGGTILTLEGASTTYNYGGELFPFSFEVAIGGPPADCNNNGIWDYLDMANCDGSPWCSDCNTNGIIDECDILDGTSEDCQPNGIPDECDIADGTSDDVDGNGVPDECCVGDITGDGITDHADLGVLLARWGSCEGDGDYDPAADLNADGCINHPDLGILLADWGCEM